MQLHAYLCSSIGPSVEVVIDCPGSERRVVEPATVMIVPWVIVLLCGPHGAISGEDDEDSALGLVLLYRLPVRRKPW